jgi:hypothetical protein
VPKGIPKMTNNNFQAKVTTEFHAGQYKHYLKITNNNYQWHSLGLSLEEMKIVKNLLSEKIEELEAENDN